MKKLERNIPGVYDFDEVLDYLHRGIMDMRTNVVWSLIQMQDTVTLAGQWDGRRDGVRCAFRVYEKYIYTHSRGYRLTLTMMLAGRDGRLLLSVVPGASHQYADIAGVEETMDWIRTLADQLTG